MMIQQLSHCLVVRLLLLIFACSSLSVAAKERVTYYHNDLLGSPVAATNVEGTVLWQEEYAAYGKRLIKEDQRRNTRWFTGKSEAAALGIQYFDARWYDADLGRFLSIDPVDFQEGNVHSFNRYVYANNNPYRYVDPDGRQSIDINHEGPGIPTAEVPYIRIPGAEIGPINGVKRGILPNGDFVEGTGRASGRGALNPKVSDAAARGRQMHKERDYGPGFEKEFTLPSGKRPDAVSFEKRTEIELKPNNPRAIKRGEKQVEGYRRELEQTYGGSWKGKVETYD